MQHLFLIFVDFYYVLQTLKLKKSKVNQTYQFYKYRWQLETINNLLPFISCYFAVNYTIQGVSKIFNYKISQNNKEKLSKKIT